MKFFKESIYLTAVIQCFGISVVIRDVTMVICDIVEKKRSVNYEI